MTKINPDLIDAGKLPRHIVEGVILRVFKRVYRLYGLPKDYDLDDLYQTLYLYALQTKLDPTFPKSRQVAYLDKSLTWSAYARLYDAKRPCVRNRNVGAVSFSSCEYADALVPDNCFEESIEYSERKRIAEEIFQLASEILPQKTIEAVRAVYYEGKKYRQVAEEWGVSTSRVQERTKRFIDAIRKEFEGRKPCL